MNETKKPSPDHTDDLAQRAFRISIGTAVFLGLLALAFQFFLEPPAADTNRIPLAPVFAAVSLAALVSAVLARRQRPVIGIWILLGAVYAANAVITYFSPADSLLIMGLMLIFASGLASTVLSGNTLGRAMAVTLAAGLVILLIGLFSPVVSADQGLGNTVFAVIPILSLYGLFIARQFRKFSLQIKLIIAFIFVGLIGAAFSYGTALFNINRLTEGTLPLQQTFGELAVQSSAVQAEAVEFVASGEEEALEELSTSIDQLDALSAQITDFAVSLDAADEFTALAENTSETAALALALVESHAATLEALETMEEAEEELEDLLAEGQAVIDAEIARNLAALDIEELEEDAIPARLFLASFAADGKVIQAEALEYVATSESASVAEFEEAVERLAAARAGLAETLEADEPGEAALIDSFRAVALDIETASQTTVESHTQTLDLLEAFEEAETALEGSLSSVEQLINQNVSLSAAVTERISIIAVIVAIVLSTGLGVLTANLITRPVFNLVDVAQKLGAGDLSAQAQVRTSDEIGTLALAFNDMAAQLKQTLGRLDRRARQLETSTDVSRQLSTILDEQELAAAVVARLQEAFSYYHVHIYLLDRANDTLVMAGGTGRAGAEMLASGHQLSVGKGLVGRAAAGNTAVLVPDVSQEESWLPNPLLPDTKAEVAIPIAAGDQVLGVLDVQQDATGSLGQADVELLQSIAGQVAVGLQNARLYARAEQQARQASIVNEIGEQIRAAGDVEMVLQVAARELAQQLGAPRATVEISRSTLTGNGRAAGKN